MYKSILLFAITLFLCINVSGQNDLENINVWVRVYNLEGKKINKGKILSITDTSLLLHSLGKSTSIPLRNIGSIKTKHSAGNNVFVGAVSGAATLAIIGVASADPDAWFGHTSGEGAALGAIVGGTVGAGIGGITILFKNSKSYVINGDKVKWKAFKELIIK